MAMLNNPMVRITHCICSRWAFHTRLKVESRKEVLSQLRDRVGQSMDRAHGVHQKSVDGCGWMWMAYAKSRHRFSENRPFGLVIGNKE